MIQNAVDALEDAYISKLPSPLKIEVFVNLADNFVGVLDSGIGMTPDQLIHAFAPNVSFKTDPQLKSLRGRRLSYRGYKGVGLTFLAYGCDDIRLHSKKQGNGIVKTRMQYGRSWALEGMAEPAMVVEDKTPSPLDDEDRGTYIQVAFSKKTRPKSLSHMASEPKVWEVILRTRTAVGQINFGGDTSCDFSVTLTVVDRNREDHMISVKPTFLFPHHVTRKPPFRFINVSQFWKTWGEHSDVKPEYTRQDGIYIEWNSSEIAEQLTEEQKEKFKIELDEYNPFLYAFLPYQGIIWRQINELAVGGHNRRNLLPGLVIGLNRQRLADVFDITASRFETLSRNLFVLVHFEGAKPDQGRKTLQEEVSDLAQKAADRALQYLSRQRNFLKPAGDQPTPDGREIERNHEDWLFNVRTHASNYPLHISPITYRSVPLAEQDVVGLFHQLSVVGVFPGLEVYATSQQKTYDCLARYNCDKGTPGVSYSSETENCLGISPYVFGDNSEFTTKYLTVEFKNNLDRLIADCDNDSPKSFTHIDICVCWGIINNAFKGYELSSITEANIDERRFPGATHILRKDGETHSIQVIMLQEVVKRLDRGWIPSPEQIR